VTQTLAELGPVKLLDDEQSRLREAADTLFFSEAMDAAATAAIQDSRAVLDHLVSCGRWTEERAAQLADDLAACGPLTSVS
jgi:hypothetical protein